MNLDDFKIKMSNSSPDEMGDIIEQMLDSKEIDFENEEVRESIREYRAQLEDYRNDLHLQIQQTESQLIYSEILNVKVEQDKTCNEWIESGKCDLYLCKKDIQYLCKKDIQWWKSGNRYYIRIDDTKSQAISNLKEVMDRLKPEVIERINSMKPLFWVISDNGIGTLKSRHLFTTQDGEIFEDYFEKI